mmetsp:Transcript_28223/g.60111  ORF Transcript_28223/g.60111 Transcript_28223/m.60111 type:complete len:394 (+) Transcript_28223:937-2118(+)
MTTKQDLAWAISALLSTDDIGVARDQGEEVLACLGAPCVPGLEALHGRAVAREAAAVALELQEGPRGEEAVREDLYVCSSIDQLVFTAWKPGCTDVHGASCSQLFILNQAALPLGSPYYPPGAMDAGFQCAATIDYRFKPPLLDPVVVHDPATTGSGRATAAAAADHHHFCLFRAKPVRGLLKIRGGLHRISVVAVVVGVVVVMMVMVVMTRMMLRTLSAITFDLLMIIGISEVGDRSLHSQSRSCSRRKQSNREGCLVLCEEVVGIRHWLQVVTDWSVPSRRKKGRNCTLRKGLKVIVGITIVVAAMPRLGLLCGHADCHRHEIDAGQGDLHIIWQFEEEQSALGLVEEAFGPLADGEFDGRFDAQNSLVMQRWIPISTPGCPQQKGLLEFR